MSTKRLWPFDPPFVPLHVPRPKPMRRPSLAQSIARTLRRSWASTRSLLDVLIKDAQRRAWAADKAAQRALREGLDDDADAWAAEADRHDGELGRLKRRQAELEGKERG